MSDTALMQFCSVAIACFLFAIYSDWRTRRMIKEGRAYTREAIDHVTRMTRIMQEIETDHSGRETQKADTQKNS